MLRRVMGKASFFTLQDSSGRIQCYVRREQIGEEAYQAFNDLWDIGDIVGVTGTLFRTNKGELTVEAQQRANARKVDAAVAGEIPRTHRSGNAVAPALSRSDDERRNAHAVREAQRNRFRRFRSFFVVARLSRSRNADDASDSSAALRRARSSRITTRSTWNCICASRRSCI